MSSVLAIDVGTSAVKAAVVDDGVVIAATEVTHPISTPRPGWTEQHPDDWWTATVRAVRTVVGTPGIDRSTIAVLAVTGQMQDLIPVDADGAPVRPAILYSDVRAVTEHAELQREIGADAWANAVGAPPDASNVAAKWRWLCRHEPDRASATATVLLGGHSFVVSRLTGRQVCDPTTASTTGLYEVGAGRWWAPLVEALGIPLPGLVAATDVAGDLSGDVADELGLPAGLPVVHANGDAVATTVGIVGRDVGRPYAYLGTSGWVAVGTPAPPLDSGVVVLPGLDADHWVAAAPMPTAGAALDWLRGVLTEGVGVPEEPDAPDTTGQGLDALAGDACAAAEGVLFVPHLDGVRFPIDVPDATGIMIGARRSTTRATIAAAGLEGVGHAIRQLVSVVAPDTAELVVCGGAARSAALRQAIADVCAVEVLHRDADHAAVLGAAVAGSIAIGREITPSTSLGTALHPRPERADVHRRSAVVFDDLVPTMQPLLTRLVEIRSSGTPDSTVPAERPDT